VQTWHDFSSSHGRFALESQLTMSSSQVRHGLRIRYAEDFVGGLFSIRGPRDCISLDAILLNGSDAFAGHRARSSQIGESGNTSSCKTSKKEIASTAFGDDY